MKNTRTLAVLTAFMLWLLAFLFAVPPVVAAYQIPGLTSSAPAASPQPAAAPADPLGRENPRSCILGFIKAAQEERYSVAIQYFQPPTTHRRHAVEDEEELASQFLTILNEKFGGPLDFLSRDPQGRLDDGLPPDQEKLNGALGASDKYPILLVRIEDEHGRKLWYVARSTLDHVPEMYDALAFPEVEKQIPKVLVENRFLSMPYWQWLAILLFIPVAWLAGRLIHLLAGGILRAWRKRRGLPVPPARRFLSIDPVTLALAILIHYLLVSYVGTSLLYRLYYRKVIWILLTVAFYWILTWVTRSIARRIGASLTSRGMLAQRSVVSLVRRFTEVVIFLFLALTVLHSLGMDVTTALAGVGIGGLALGLGAQKTFENMFGGISLLFDKVIQVGDVCKVGTQVGTVEDIGLRSTRLRTADRTLLSVPNGIMATVTLENFRFRDKFLCQQVIRLRYDLSPDHVRYVLNEIWQLLKQNPKVEETSARVRFLRFAEYALEIEL
ncbi:MAG TPA: mechanosensitive ion channel domain-containing protein, partial [Candidatus Acidoferrum sp.]